MGVKKKREIDDTIRYKCRIVVKGFMQVPGTDFTEHFSLVATDATIRLIYAMVLWNSEWTCHMFDVEAAFLNATLDKSMYIEWPPGITQLKVIDENTKNNTCIELVKSMYGNVDAALRRMRIFTDIMITKVGMTLSRADPCLFLQFNTDKKLQLLVAVYVDDVLIAGELTDIEKLKNAVKQVVNITDLGLLRKHCGIWYEWGYDPNGNKYLEANMNDFVQALIADYEKEFGMVSYVSTPGKQNTVLSKNEETPHLLDKYRSFLGRLMYYVVKLAPDCANAGRELSQFMSNPNKTHWEAMTRIIGYLKTKKEHTL